MSVSKKQQACVNRYIRDHYDRLQATAPRGYKAAIQTAAAMRGLSVSGYIVDAIRAALDADGVTLPVIQNGGGSEAADQDDGGG